jgi:hypothetical protein
MSDFIDFVRFFFSDKARTSAVIGLLANIAIWALAPYVTNLPVDLIKAFGAVVEMFLLTWAGYSRGHCVGFCSGYEYACNLRQ